MATMGSMRLQVFFKKNRLSLTIHFHATPQDLKLLLSRYHMSLKLILWYLIHKFYHFRGKGGVICSRGFGWVILVSHWHMIILFMERLISPGTHNKYFCLSSFRPTLLSPSSLWSMIRHQIVPCSVIWRLHLFYEAVYKWFYDWGHPAMVVEFVHTPDRTSSATRNIRTRTLAWIFRFRTQFGSDLGRILGPNQDRTYLAYAGILRLSA